MRTRAAVAAACGLAFAVASLAVAGDPKVSVSGVTVTSKTRPAPKAGEGKVYLSVAFTAKANEAATKEMVKIFADCKAGDKSVTDEVWVMGLRLSAMKPGDTKQTDMPILRKAALDAAPTACDLTFKVGESGSKATMAELGKYCYKDGKVADGACTK